MISTHAIIADFEKQQMDQKQDIPSFRPGDSVVVAVKVKEGTRERIQNFEGVVIAYRKRGFNSSFTVRKISYGEGVERTFHLYSPQIESIKVTRFGKVRRAKLYYLRELTGKKARIKERIVRKNKPAKASSKTNTAPAEPEKVSTDTKPAEKKAPAAKQTEKKASTAKKASSDKTKTDRKE